jgi:hypothetical protein
VIPVTTPTDLQATIRDKDIAIRFLLSELDQAEATIQDRERRISELEQELFTVK